MYDWIGNSEEGTKIKDHVVHVVWKRGSTSYQGLCAKNSSDIFLNALKKTRAENIKLSLLSHSSIRTIRTQLGGRYFNDPILEKYLLPTALDHSSGNVKRFKYSWVLMLTLLVIIILGVVYIVS